MIKSLQSLTLCLALVAFNAYAQIAVQPEFIGHWKADARLFDKHIRAQANPLPAELVFDQNFTLSGKVGNALVPPTKPISITSSRVEYWITLNKPVRDIAELNKLRMVVIISRGPAATLDADFHLKSRFGFDRSIRVGHFDASHLGN